MTIDKKSPDKAEGREKHVKEHLAEMTDADLDKVAGGIEPAAERYSARKRSEELCQSMQRMLESQKSILESQEAKQRQIIRDIYEEEKAKSPPSPRTEPTERAKEKHPDGCF